MVKKKGAASKRDFGGKGKKDMFTLKTPKSGISKAAANKKAKALRKLGWSCVVDHGVGGTKKYGVYARKSKRKKAKKKAATKKSK